MHDPQNKNGAPAPIAPEVTVVIKATHSGIQIGHPPDMMLTLDILAEAQRLMVKRVREAIARAAASRVQVAGGGLLRALPKDEAK